MERRRVVSSEEIDELIKTTPPDQMIERMTELMDRRAQYEMSEANLEEKPIEQWTLQLLMTKLEGRFSVLHLLIMSNPTSTVKLLDEIIDVDQFTQLIFMKDSEFQRNSLSRAVRYLQTDVVRYIYARLNKDNLYKLLHDQDKRGDTAFHSASWWNYPLDELIEPFTATESHKLLSIRNNEGQTYAMMQDKMRPFLKREASSQEIDQWFESTSSDVLIEKLTSTMDKWGFKDLDRLNLVARLTAGQIADLVKSRRGQERLSVLHALIVRDPTSAVKLLKQITVEDQITRLIFMKDGAYQCNSLSRAAEFSQSDVMRCIYNRLSKDNLYKLLRDQDKYGNTALHYASWRNYPLDEIFEPFTTTSHELLSIQNNEGQTVLSSFIHRDKLKSFLSLINAYCGRQSELLDLAAIEDNEGNTSFHYAAGCDTSDYLTILIQATHTLETRKRFADILKQSNSNNEVVKPPPSWQFLHKPPPANRTIYQWALESSRKRQYLLFDYPKVIVISNNAKRDGAEEEAKTVINCFQSLGFKVEPRTNQKKQEILNDLKEASKSKTGLIVAIMSHGEEGFILDNEGERIDINKEIEESMTHHDRCTPKCLILQCCQGPTKSEETSLWFSPEEADAGPSYKAATPYVPTRRHLCVFMSTIPGRAAQRNKFIPAFVKAIELLEPDSCISEAYAVAADELFLKFPAQKPLFQSLLMRKFCIKNALPLVLNRAEENEVVEQEVTDIEADNGAHSGAQAGAIGGA